MGGAVNQQRQQYGNNQYSTPSGFSSGTAGGPRNNNYNNEYESKQSYPSKHRGINSMSSLELQMIIKVIIMIIIIIIIQIIIMGHIIILHHYNIKQMIHRINQIGNMIC